MRRCIAMALGPLSRRREHPSNRLEPYDALRSQCTTDGGGTHAYAAAVMQLIDNLLLSGLRALCDDIVQGCEMLRLQCWRLSTGWMFCCHGILL
jgi:hypothetical protein